MRFYALEHVCIILYVKCDIIYVEIFTQVQHFQRIKDFRWSLALLEWHQEMLSLQTTDLEER